MQLTFKKRLTRFVGISIAAFLVFFIFRFVYGFTTGANEYGEEYISDFFSDLEDVKHNYASDRYTYVKSEAYDGSSVSKTATQEAAPQHQVDVTQKYEKTATVKSKSVKFEEEEKRLREKIKTENAIIQYEQNSGGKGNRELHLLIGVAPDKFDAFYQDMLKIGSIKSKEITKIDKTNEFRNLNAKKASLETTRQSLIELKRQSGKIEEFVNLQNRILEIEQQLQDLGVLLGNFDEENEFCTVRFSLHETREIKISILHRIKVAFEWSVQYYLLFLAIVALAAFAAFFILLIIDKIIPGIMSRLNQ